MSKMADKVIKNGHFYSIDIKGSLTKSEAVAIENGRFVYVGNNAGAEKFIKPKTEVIDLNGKMVLSGMSDCHVHASWTALSMNSVSMYGKTKEEGKLRNQYIDEYKRMLSNYLQENPEENIIRGAGFDAGLFITDKGGYPTRFDLDEVSIEKPIVLRSYCFHYAWVNSKALELAGIDQATLNVRNGTIYRDEQGYPTGFFQEMGAVDLIINGVSGYDFSVEEYKNVILNYQKNFANNYGITMIFDALATPNAMCAYQQLAKEDKLTMRVRGCHYADPTSDSTQFTDLCQRIGKDNINDKYQINTVKFFMDGSGLAFYLGEPFEQSYLEMSNKPKDYRGYPIWTDEETKTAFLELSKAGYQIHIHAMGDGAVRQSLDAFEYVNRKTGKIGHRNTIAHVMHIREADIERMAQLNVIAAMMPCWMYVETIYEFYYVALMGVARSEKFYPMKSLLNAGVRVATGTDFPVTVPPNPFHEIQFAITRSIMKSLPDYERYKGIVMGPENDPIKECVSLKEIVECLTISGAYQHGIEDIAGSIEVGKSADMVVLSQNLETISKTEIENTEVCMTFFEGNLVYSRSKR